MVSLTKKNEVKTMKMMCSNNNLSNSCRSNKEIVMMKMRRRNDLQLTAIKIKCEVNINSKKSKSLNRN